MYYIFSYTFDTCCPNGGIDDLRGHRDNFEEALLLGTSRWGDDYVEIVASINDIWYLVAFKHSNGVWEFFEDHRV